METWSFYSAGIRIARFWPAAGTLEWACLDDGTGVLGCLLYTSDAADE